MLEVCLLSQRSIVFWCWVPLEWGLKIQVSSFCAKKKEWRNHPTHLFLDSDTSPCGVWLVPRTPHASQCFPGSLHLCRPPGWKKMVLVLERLSMFKGPNFPRATCFSRPQVIAQEPDGWPGHQTALVRSHFPFMAGCCGYQIDAHIWNSISLSLSHVFK